MPISLENKLKRKSTLPASFLRLFRQDQHDQSELALSPIPRNDLEDASVAAGTLHVSGARTGATAWCPTTDIRDIAGRRKVEVHLVGGFCAIIASGTSRRTLICR